MRLLLVSCFLSGCCLLVLIVTAAYPTTGGKGRQGYRKDRNPSPNDTSTTCSVDSEELSLEEAGIVEQADKSFDKLLHHKMFHEGWWLKQLTNPAVLVRDIPPMFEEYISVNFENEKTIKLLKKRARVFWHPGAPNFQK